MEHLLQSPHQMEGRLKKALEPVCKIQEAMQKSSQIVLVVSSLCKCHAGGPAVSPLLGGAPMHQEEFNNANVV
jgi:hypothetical protein